MFIANSKTRPVKTMYLARFTSITFSIRKTAPIDERIINPGSIAIARTGCGVPVVIAEGSGDKRINPQRRSVLRLKYLESITDPETNKYATDVEPKGYLFAMQADDTSVIGNLWSLEWTWTSGSTAKALLMDMEGNGLEFDLTCSVTPNLE